jgi:hypothetical protein
MKLLRAPTLLATGLVLSVCTTAAAPQAIQPGTVSDPVQCANDPAQSYTLFLPSSYSPDRQWSVLFAFHPAARGRLMVDKYQVAAEQYGVIVVASNNSRNGPHAASAAAAQAMSADVSRRFSIDPQRVYLTGMSGGARVALTLALAGNNIAGVIASAGYPDSQPRATVPFALFSTAGTEDFNYPIGCRLEQRPTSHSRTRSSLHLPPTLRRASRRPAQAARQPRDERSQSVCEWHLRRPDKPEPGLGVLQRLHCRHADDARSRVRGTYNPSAGTATWVDRSYDLGDIPITDVVRDDVTGDLYASSDFGVFRLLADATEWGVAAPGMPKAEVAGLTMIAAERKLYAATHGLGAWLLNLQ